MTECYQRLEFLGDAILGNRIFMILNLISNVYKILNEYA